MKRLTEEFVVSHLDEPFMIGINALYWCGTCTASMSNVLDNDELPDFSEDFYRCYGEFSPWNPNKAIEEIREDRFTIQTLDGCVLWENFVIDVIGFYKHYKCLNCPCLSGYTCLLKRKIRDKFFDHIEFIADIDNGIHDRNQKAYAKKLYDDYNDARMLRFFEFKDYLNNQMSVEV
jgi:hypothetical protein